MLQCYICKQNYDENYMFKVCDIDKVTKDKKYYYECKDNKKCTKNVIELVESSGVPIVCNDYIYIGKNIHEKSSQIVIDRLTDLSAFKMGFNDIKEKIDTSQNNDTKQNNEKKNENENKEKEQISKEVLQVRIYDDNVMYKQNLFDNYDIIQFKNNGIQFKNGIIPDILCLFVDKNSRFINDIILEY